MVNAVEWRSEDKKHLVSWQHWKFAVGSFFKWKKKSKNKFFIDVKKSLLEQFTASFG